MYELLSYLYSQCIKRSNGVSLRIYVGPRYLSSVVLKVYTYLQYMYIHSSETGTYTYVGTYVLYVLYSTYQVLGRRLVLVVTEQIQLYFSAKVFSH